MNTGTETYTHTGLTNGTTYYYRISAVDNSGNESSKTSDVNAIPDDGPPATPTGLIASPGDGRAYLSWNANSESDLGGYYIYGARQGNTQAKVGTNSKGDQTFTHPENGGSTNGVPPRRPPRGRRLSPARPRLRR